MKIRKSVKVLLILLISIFIISIMQNLVFASSTTEAITAMGNMKGADIEDGTGKLGNVINAVIGLIQVAGTGISMIMVTMLGIKYILAAPSDKADVKKQIAPLVVGAIILFAAVNLVSIVATIADKTLSEAAG